MSVPGVLFVCLGNICRSPMGEVVLREMADRAGVPIEVSSAGVSTGELGNPIDRRARQILEEAGYPVPVRQATLVTAEAIREATLVLAAEESHRRRLLALAPDADNIRLLSDFIPGAEPGSPVDDPWYGDLDDFRVTLAAVEQAAPGIIAAVG